MPSGKCPYCKRDTVFTQRYVGEQSKSRHVPRIKVGQDHRGMIGISECGHKDCKALVYRVTGPDSDEIEWDIYPPTEVKVDDELPDRVKRAFQDALGASTGGLWGPCCTTLRTALEEAVDHFKPTDPDALKKWGGDLNSHIKYLVDSHQLTDELGEWAHENRVMGRTVAHAPEWNYFNATKEDAEELLELTRWLFKYMFVLPKQLAERKARAQATRTPKP